MEKIYKQNKPECNERIKNAFIVFSIRADKNKLRARNFDTKPYQLLIEKKIERNCRDRST